jgi:hypothetical protein
MTEPGVKLLFVIICCQLIFLSIQINGQPVCNITGGADEICYGNSTTWSAPDGMIIYLWNGPSGFSAFTRDVTISSDGSYTLIISDLSGTSTCSRTLITDPELLPGSINTTFREFCAGGTTVIGGTNPPYGPATGGSGSYNYTWQLQVGCMDAWIDIPLTNTTSYTPVAPSITTCYRRKVTDMVCNNEAWTDFKRFEIFEDPVSQTIVPQPANLTVCAGFPVSATFTGGSGGFPGGTVDIYEYSSNGGGNWSVYSPGQDISTTGLSGPDIIRIRTRRIPISVGGCNYGLYVIVAWSVNPLPGTSAIYHW